MRHSSFLQGAAFLQDAATPALILRSRAKRGVSKDDPAGGAVRALCNVLRDPPSALLRTRSGGSAWGLLFFTLALAVAVGAAPALAQGAKAGDIVTENAWARATPKGAEVGGGYLTIENKGAAPDRLTGGTADFATVEVHRMTTENGVMKMRELKNGLAIPAHGSVALAPGGTHLMFTHLKRPLVKGDTLKVTLNFDHAGPIAVEFPVQGLGASGPPPGGGMKGMKM